MTLSAAPIRPTNHHHDDVLSTLQKLASYDNDDKSVEFCFDVPLHQFFVVANTSNLETVEVGNLSLAIYNDLKLSQFIREDDNYTTFDKRRFSLTDRGRLMAETIHV